MVTPEWLKRIQSASDAEGRTVASWVRMAIRHALMREQANLSAALREINSQAGPPRADAHAVSTLLINEKSNTKNIRVAAEVPTPARKTRTVLLGEGPHEIGDTVQVVEVYDDEPITGARAVVAQPIESLHLRTELLEDHRPNEPLDNGFAWPEGPLDNFATSSRQAALSAALMAYPGADLQAVIGRLHERLTDSPEQPHSLDRLARYFAEDQKTSKTQSVDNAVARAESGEALRQTYLDGPWQWDGDVVEGGRDWTFEQFLAAVKRGEVKL